MVLEMVGNPTAWQLFRSPFWKFYDTKILYACSCGYWHICFLVVLVLSFKPKWWSYRPVAPHPTIIFFIWLLSMQPWSWVFILPNCPGFMWQYCLHVMRAFSCRSCCFLSCGHYPAGKWKRSSSLLLPHLLPFLPSVHSPDDFSDEMAIGVSCSSLRRYRPWSTYQGTSFVFSGCFVRYGNVVEKNRGSKYAKSTRMDSAKC